MCSTVGRGERQDDRRGDESIAVDDDRAVVQRRVRPKMLSRSVDASASIDTPLETNSPSGVTPFNDQQGAKRRSASAARRRTVSASLVLLNGRAAATTTARPNCSRARRALRREQRGITRSARDGCAQQGLEHGQVEGGAEHDEREQDQDAADEVAAEVPAIRLSSQYNSSATMTSHRAEADGPASLLTL
jgi:hypothetical protein